MNKTYYDTISTMEKKGVDKEYINGWACGFLHNPKREEQRLNDAYNAGFDDGHAGKTDGYSNPQILMGEAIRPRLAQLEIERRMRQ